MNLLPSFGVAHAWHLCNAFTLPEYECLKEALFLKRALHLHGAAATRHVDCTNFKSRICVYRNQRGVHHSQLSESNRKLIYISFHLAPHSLLDSFIFLGSRPPLKLSVERVCARESEQIKCGAIASKIIARTKKKKERENVPSKDDASKNIEFFFEKIIIERRRWATAKMTSSPKRTLHTRTHSHSRRSNYDFVVWEELWGLEPKSITFMRQRTDATWKENYPKWWIFSSASQKAN